MLEVRRMRVLREVAARGGISAAAEALGYTHSAVSQQLQALQRECGASLLRRRGRGVALTDAGQVLVAHTEPVLAALERAEAALAACVRGAAGRLRIGSFPTANRGLVPGALAALREAHPGVEPELTELEPEQALPALAVGDLDVALAHEYDLCAPREHAGVHRLELLSEPVLAIGGPAGAIALRDFADADWILPAPGSACAELVQRACHAAGFEPHAVARTGDFAAAAALAEAGAGVTLVPRLGLPERPLAVPVRAVAEPPVRRRIFAATRAGAQERPAIAALLSALANIEPA